MLYDESRKVEVYGEEIPVKYPEGTGIKTGYTSDAGSCLVSGVIRDGQELISVILKSEGMNMYADTISLLEYGLHNFETVTYLKKGDVMFTRPLLDSDREEMKLVLAEDLMATVNKNDLSSCFVDGEITGATTDGAIKAPVNAGDVFGRAWVKNAGGQTLASVDIVAQNAAGLLKEEVADPREEGVGTLSLVFRIIGIVCLIAIVIVIIAIIRATVNRHRRRRNRMYGAKLNSSVDTQEVRRIKDLNRRKRRGR
jgi:D-alanyl-D-alanine carboxypeptidase (penicillin-binding protein 5/6)